MLRILKLVFPAFAALFLLGCAQEGAEDATEETADTTAVAEGISLADLAGTWNMVTTSTDPADTVVNRFQIVIDEAGLTAHYPDRDPVTATVVIEGDNLIADAGPNEAIRRPGTMVTTHTVFRMEGDRLVGTTTAHYQTTDPDSVVTLRAVGTRAP